VLTEGAGLSRSQRRCDDGEDRRRRYAELMDGDDAAMLRVPGLHGSMCERAVKPEERSGGLRCGGGE